MHDRQVWARFTYPAIAAAARVRISNWTLLIGSQPRVAAHRHAHELSLSLQPKGIRIGGLGLHPLSAGRNMALSDT